MYSNQSLQNTISELRSKLQADELKLIFILLATRWGQRGPCRKPSSIEAFFKTSFRASEKLHLLIKRLSVRCRLNDKFTWKSYEKKAFIQENADVAVKCTYRNPGTWTGHMEDQTQNRIQKHLEEKDVKQVRVGGAWAEVYHLWIQLLPSMRFIHIYPVFHEIFCQQLHIA